MYPWKARQRYEMCKCTFNVTDIMRSFHAKSNIQEPDSARLHVWRGHQLGPARRTASKWRNRKKDFGDGPVPVQVRLECRPQFPLSVMDFAFLSLQRSMLLKGYQRYESRTLNTFSSHCMSIWPFPYPKTARRNIICRMCTHFSVWMPSPLLSQNLSIIDGNWGL